MTEAKSNIEGAINAVSGLVEKVPVYQDAIQPLAKETGKALETVGRTVNAALLPIRGLVWGIEQIEVFVQRKLAAKLENVSPEDIQTPGPAVAGPAIESLRFTGHKEDLAELYVNLLATSMDKNTARTAHPGFVEIIRNLSGDEARILSFLGEAQVIPIVDIRRENKDGSGGITVCPYVSTIGQDAGCEHRDLTGTYMKNLERLGLIDIPRTKRLTADGIYDRILNDPPVKEMEAKLNALEHHMTSFEKYYAQLSELGSLFIAACVHSRDKV
jgi:hypothetical protein